jgi:DNA-binding response OmpR family regulator
MTSSETKPVRREQAGRPRRTKLLRRSSRLPTLPGTVALYESLPYMAYILIVDSQAEFRHRLLRLLEQAGHRATAVATVSEAASILQTETPDLLATDVVLTDGSSAALTKQAEAAGAKTLMMTGNPDRIVEFDGAGQPYLSKPFLPDIFLKRVEQILAPD